MHRDIKPGNIMLLPRGQAKIMDFGIARMRSDDFKTSTGIVMGTPRFMSPEQVAGDPVDHRSDIFSLGVVLYEMLTGTALFAGEDTPQIAHNVANLEHVPPSRLNPEVPSMLDFAVARALKKDPAVRYQDAYEFAVDLRTCLAELRARETAAKKDANGSGTRTLKLDSTADRAPLAPAARSIASDTRLPLSRQFDSFAAVQRLAAQNRRDRKLLAAAPRPVEFLRRVSRDAGPRLLFLTSLVAAAAGAYVGSARRAPPSRASGVNGRSRSRTAGGVGERVGDRRRRPGPASLRRRRATAGPAGRGARTSTCGTSAKRRIG